MGFVLPATTDSVTLLFLEFTGYSGGMNETREPNDPHNEIAAIRATFARNLGLIIFVTFGAIIAVVLTSAHTSVRYSSEVAVKSAEEQARAELMRFFVPIETQLALLVDWSKDGLLSLDSPESLNRMLIPILRSQSAATSLLIASDDGREYMLLKTSDGWLNRRIDRRTEPRASHWLRMSSTGEVLDTYDQDLDYESKTRPWFIGAKEKNGTVSWTEPYTFFTTQNPGITASVRVATPSGTLTIALDLLLHDISNYTTSLQTSGAVAVTTSSGKVLGLPRDPRFVTAQQQKGQILTSLADLHRPALVKGLEDYQNNQGGTRRAMIGQDPWWITAKDAGLPNLDLVVIVAIPESAFRRSMDTQQALMAVIALGALLAAGILIWRTRRALARFEDRTSSRRIFGSFTLRELIVSNSEVEVFRADHDSLQRPMIIKIFKGSLPHNIGQTITSLQAITDPHAGIPIEFGVTSDGTFFQADFDYGGVTLRALLLEGPIAIEQAIGISRQVCIALKDAHDHGLIHGNLRPSNIMIEHRGADENFVRVIDFCIEPGDLDAAENAGFVAPERIENPDNQSPAIDVYALGAILYEMLNRRPAYTGKTTTAILMKQLTEPPAEMEEYVPEFLKNVVAACLERRPAQRATLDVVAEALNASTFRVVAEATGTPRPPMIEIQNRTPA